VEREREEGERARRPWFGVWEVLLLFIWSLSDGAQGTGHWEIIRFLFGIVSTVAYTSSVGEDGVF
jgi:hypothetical protein